MTSEAHKRNPPGSERWGEVNKLSIPRPAELEAMQADIVGSPRLYEWKGAIFVEAKELEMWRAARIPVQAAGAQQ